MTESSIPTVTGSPKWDSRKRVFFATTVMIAMVVISYCLMMLMPEAQSEVKQPSEIELLTQQSLVIAEELKTAKEEHVKWEAKENEARKARDENRKKIDNYINSDLKQSTTVITNRNEGDTTVEAEASSVDLDKLAYAISQAETKNCTLGYGKQYNNCFGIKNGSISPCKKQGNNRMCIYGNTQESFVAFKAIWTKGYGGRYPTYRDAQVWTGNDRPDNWLKNVEHFYNS